MKAVVNDTVVAEAPESELIKIEGNWYFPPARVNAALLENSDTAYHCSWKGECQYFHLRDGDGLLQDQAWSYPDPIPASFDRVGRDYSGYVTFGKDVQIVP